jgi:hypothetical protein
MAMNESERKRLCKQVGLSYRRYHLRPDDQPADCVVRRIFRDLSEIRRTPRPQLKAREQALRVANIERNSWQQLLDYLLTLERPEGRGGLSYRPYTFLD